MTRTGTSLYNTHCNTRATYSSYHLGRAARHLVQSGFRCSCTMCVETAVMTPAAHERAVVG